MRAIASLAVLASLCTAARTSRAEEASTAPCVAERAGNTCASASNDARARGDPATFRGRVERSEGADIALAPIRLVLAPAYVVTEYGLREPVYAATSWADRHHVFPILDDIMHPTPDITWYPLLSFDLGVFVAGGAGLDVKNFLARGDSLHATAEIGSPDAWLTSLANTLERGPLRVGVRWQAFDRSDRSFYGFGPYSGTDRMKFSERRFEAFAFASADLGRHARIEASEGIRFEKTAWVRGFAAAPETIVPGFGATHLGVATLDLRADTRPIEDASHDEESGARVDATLTYGRDFLDPERAFVRGAVNAEAAVEVMRPDRILALRGYVVDSAPLAREPVPFLEQAMLGWKDHFGFIWGRFRDESAVLAELRYRYPIAYFVDLMWVASAGNVFARNFSDFELGALTGSLGAGLRTRRTGHAPIELVFALGTSRFEERFAIQSVRLALVTTEGL